MDHERMLGSLPAIVWQADSAGRFTYVSPGSDALLGYPAKLWLQPNFWSQHLHPDDSRWVLEYRAAHIAAGRSFSYEYRMTAADGRVVWLRDSATVEVERGRAVRVHGVMVEVQERHAGEQMQELLARDGEAHSVLQGLFQYAPIGLALFDRDLRFVLINDRLAAMNGVPVEAHLGRRIDEIVPVIAERVEPMLRSVFETGQVVEGVEITGETPAEPGQRRHWLAGFLPIQIGGSGVTAAAGVVIEITARRRAEDALRASEARYRYLYLRTPAMMHSIDQKGRIVDVSDAWLERLGYTREEVVGRKSVEFLTLESQKYATDMVLPDFFRTGVCKDIEYQFVRKDGEILDILLSAVAERDPTGEFERSLAVLVDVTERNRAEEALRESEAQLRQAQKMEAIGRLAGGVAHDFNNLLVVILGHAELLMYNLTDSPLRDSAEQIVLAGERAAALTRQILTFSRQRVVQPRVIDLNDLIRDTESLLRRLLREDIEVLTDLSPALGRVRIDPGHATQVLMNLAVNASDAMPTGGRLVIETANVHVDDAGACEPGEYVLVTVTDTGTGMDAETQARMFEPFFTTKEVGSGTGLGLATVYGIVSQAGGCISVYSEPGRGSSFRVYLRQTEEAVGSEVVPVGPTVSADRSATVLLAEDEALVRKLVTDVLRENGYDVLPARDADEAMQILDGHDGPIDVVLTDAIMPGTTPMILVEKVRARNPHVQVVFMSGYPLRGPETSPIEPKAFLPKPFTMNQLLRKLEALWPADG